MDSCSRREPRDASLACTALIFTFPARFLSLPHFPIPLLDFPVNTFSPHQYPHFWYTNHFLLCWANVFSSISKSKSSTVRHPVRMTKGWFENLKIPSPISWLSIQTKWRTVFASCEIEAVGNGTQIYWSLASLILTWLLQNIYLWYQSKQMWWRRIDSNSEKKSSSTPSCFQIISKDLLQWRQLATSHQALMA